MVLNTQHRLVPRLKQEQSYTSTPHWAFMADYSVNSTFRTFTYEVPQNSSSVKKCCITLGINQKHEMETNKIS